MWREIFICHGLQTNAEAENCWGKGRIEGGRREFPHPYEWKYVSTSGKSEMLVIVSGLLPVGGSFSSERGKFPDRLL